MAAGMQSFGFSDGTIYITDTQSNVTGSGFAQSWPVRIVYSTHSPPLDPVDLFIARALSAAERRALWTRLAIEEQSRLARRFPIVPVARPREPELFARRTCSLSSRWMVLQ